MSKKKSDDKDNNENKAREADAQKPAGLFGSVQLSEDTINKILQQAGPIDVSLPSIAVPSLEIPSIAVPSLEIPSIKPIKIPSIGSYLSWTPPEQELEDEISALKKQNRQLLQEIAAKTETEQKKGKEIKELRKNIEELNKKQRFQHLLCRVNETAKKKLLESEEFRNLFEKSESCNAVIMSVDIRRSTELMLKAKEPKLYADFITILCADLTRVILNNYGVFDKFTGDGILAFFPEFYSGQDTPYFAMKAAHECHNCFSEHYHRERSCFKSILMDVGLGIGIDYGESHLVKMQGGLTVIGTPVVYACRMSGAKAGQTFLNQPAYEVTSQKFGEYINFQESEIDMKHEGRTLAYVATLSEKTYEPKLPDWLSSPASPKP